MKLLTYSYVLLIFQKITMMNKQLQLVDINIITIPTYKHPHTSTVISYLCPTIYIIAFENLSIKWKHRLRPWQLYFKWILSVFEVVFKQNTSTFHYLIKFGSFQKYIITMASVAVHLPRGETEKSERSVVAWKRF